MVENFSWDQEVIRILGQQALKGVNTVTVKEILKQVKSSQIKQRLVDFLKSQGLNNYGMVCYGIYSSSIGIWKSSSHISSGDSILIAMSFVN